MDPEQEEGQEHPVTIGMLILAFVVLGLVIGVPYVLTMP